jgi:CPA2 family monovalent cation:H+ antiporter-2
MPIIDGILITIFLIGLVLHRFRQPHVIGYLLAGILLGPHGLGLITDEKTLARLGSIGVVLLLFFVGMEISPKRLVANWKVAIIGTLFQILLSISLVALLGYWLDWPIARSILVGFVISLSSTAIVLRLLQDWRELDSTLGQDVLGILLVQDIAIVPMLIVASLLSGEQPTLGSMALQITGGITVIGIVAWLVGKEAVHLPLSHWLQNDHEMQVFAALIICFGMALLTALVGLSTALGAFVAGIIVASARETRFAYKSLEPFRVVFVALFFFSIGMLLNLGFVFQHWLQVFLLVAAVFVTNTFINAVILKLSGDSWPTSIYGGSLLSQIGEFSFVLAAVGLQGGLITQFGYQVSLAVIAISLLLSPGWISLIRRLFLNHE